MQAHRVVAPIILGLGLITLTGCSEHGSSQDAENVAEHFVMESMQTNVGQTFSNLKASYNGSNNEWVITGTVVSQSADKRTGDLDTNTFTVYETTNDGDNWSSINTVIH